MDGSHHRWFEERGEQCCMMVMIDDATGKRMSLLAASETTDAAMLLLWMWVERYGVPKSRYTDKRMSMFRRKRTRKTPGLKAANA